MTLLAPWLDHFVIIPLYLACVTIPIYGLVQVQAGIAQSYDWPNLALMPFYIWRQLAITVLMGAIWLLGAPTSAVTAMIVAVITTWAVTMVQLVLLNRRLKEKVPAGPKIYETKTWLATSMPIFVVEGFYLLLTYVDIICDRAFRLAARCRGLLCRRAIARDRRLRLFRHRRRHHPQIHRISRVRRPAASRLFLPRNRSAGHSGPRSSPAP